MREKKNWREKNGGKGECSWKWKPNERQRKKAEFFSLWDEVITDNVKENLDLIQSKLTNAVTNKEKQMLWEEIIYR